MFGTYLHSSRAKKSFINHVPSIRHADDQDIIQLIDSINFGE